MIIQAIWWLITYLNDWIMHHIDEYTWFNTLYSTYSPNSPVISIINRSISALIRSRSVKTVINNDESTCCTNSSSSSIVNRLNITAATGNIRQERVELHANKNHTD